MAKTVAKTRKPVAPVKKTKPATPKKKPETKPKPKPKTKPRTRAKRIPAAIVDKVVAEIDAVMEKRIPRKIPEKSTGIEIIKNVNLDFCGVKLNDRKYSFLTYYLTPGQPCFHNALQSALKAGYAESTAKADIYGMLNNIAPKLIVNRIKG